MRRRLAPRPPPYAQHVSREAASVRGQHRVLEGVEEAGAAGEAPSQHAGPTTALPRVHTPFDTT